MDSFRAGCPHCRHCSVGVRWQTLGKPWRQSTNGGGGRCPRCCLRHLASHRLLSAFRPKRPGESSATMGSLTVSGAGLVEPEASESRCRAACLVGVSQFESLRSGRSLRVEIRSSGDSDSRRPTERDQSCRIPSVPSHSPTLQVSGRTLPEAPILAWATAAPPLVPGGAETGRAMGARPQGTLALRTVAPSGAPGSGRTGGSRSAEALGVAAPWLGSGLRSRGTVRPSAPSVARLTREFMRSQD